MKAKVFFVAVADGAAPEEQARAVGRLWEASEASSRIAKEDLVAIKIHVGEEGNRTHVRPELVGEVVRQIRTRGGQPFLTETATLYRSERDNAVKHILLAHENGFSIERVGAPFILADGLVGNTELPVEIGGDVYATVQVGREVVAADALIAVSHPTGHLGTGLGGCIKNLGMGLASRMGKMRQHSTIRPEIDPGRCQLCRKCQRWCPQQAIGEREGVSYIRSQECNGCGECLAVCRFDAVKYNYGTGSRELQVRTAEHAWGAVKDKAGKSLFLNVLIDVTRDCDCFTTHQEKILRDIGILASDDPVAVDMATLDVTREVAGTDLSKLAHPHLNPTIQLRHAEKLGMGTTRYRLERVR